MILIINTAGQENIKLILASSDEKFITKELEPDNKRSEKLLSAVDDFLLENKLESSQLKGVGVVTGPGSFTAIRIGVVVGNSLSYALSIPVAGVKLSEFKTDQDLVTKIVKLLKRRWARLGTILPFYDKKPNIGNKNSK